MSKPIEIKVRFSEPIPGVYTKFQPVLGKIYDAVFYPGSRKHGCRHTAVCLLKIHNELIAIRKGEYERVEE